MLTERREGHAFAADFRVGEWLAEPSLDRLSRDGTVLRLRPQLMDLLVVLAQHAGRTVSKDVILEQVWQGQCVAESGMTRCIAEIRQALEDDAREPRIVQTIPKRGYRLVAPVEFLAPDGPPAVGPSPTNLEPAPAAALDPVPASEPPAQGGPQRLPRRVGWTMGSVLGVTLLLALTWSATGWSRAPVLTDRDRVMLADFTNTTGDTAFDGTLRLALAVNLGQAPFLHILPDEHLRSALALAGRPAGQPLVGPVALDICRREGAAVLLAGSIARLGTHYALGVEAIACRTGESLGRELVEVAGKEDVLTQLGAAAGRLRRTLGESRASLQQYDVPIVRATTPSLEALQALSLGDVSRDHARLGDALTHYRRATELDPQFALAWARRGAAAHNMTVMSGEDRAGAADEPAMAFAKAYDLRDRVSEPERFYILGHYYRFVAGGPEKAIDTYRMWKRTYPGSVVPPTNLASLYIDQYGQYDAALVEAREAVRIAPYSSVAHSMRIMAYLGSDQIREARQALRDAIDRGAADLLVHDVAFGMALADGDAAGIAEEVRWSASSPGATLAFTLARASAAANAGRLAEARRLWAEAARTASESGPPSRLAAVRIAEAQTEAVLGDPRKARLAADAALSADRRTDTLLSAALALVLSGEAARAGRLADEAALRTNPSAATTHVWLPVIRALADGASGHADRALEILRQTAPFERGRGFGMTPLAVRASLERSAGRPLDAAATFQSFLRLRRVVPTSPWLAFSRLGVARALRDAGDTAGSRAAYDLALDTLRGADAEAPLLIAARREREALGQARTSTPAGMQGLPRPAVGQ